MLLAGHPDVEGLCLALSDRSSELCILQDEQRRRKQTRRREKLGMAEDQPLSE
jgi:hypothetical protein